MDLAEFHGTSSRARRAEAVTFQAEELADIAAELADLIIAHHREIGLYDLPLDPDMARYLSMEQNGQLLLVTARDRGKLVGYATNFLFLNPHYRVLHAYGDLYYVYPEYRNGTGLKMLRFVEQEARKRGVVLMNNAARPGNGAIFKRLGYSMLEVTYTKRLA